jgi:hypothetical protein
MQFFFSETHIYEFTRTNIDIFTAVRTSTSTCLFLYSTYVCSTPITTCADIQYDCLLHSTAQINATSTSDWHVTVKRE